MSDLISREEVIKCVESRNEKLMHDEEYRKKRGDVDLLGIIPLIHNIPSADIMECARAIKEYCDGKKCDKCTFKSKDPMYICSLSHEVPCFWDLPESEDMRGGKE